MAERAGTSVGPAARKRACTSDAARTRGEGSRRDPFRAQPVGRDHGGACRTRASPPRQDARPRAAQERRIRQHERSLGTSDGIRAQRAARALADRRHGDRIGRRPRPRGAHTRSRARVGLPAPPRTGRNTAGAGVQSHGIPDATRRSVVGQGRRCGRTCAPAAVRRIRRRVPSRGREGRFPVKSPLLQKTVARLDALDNRSRCVVFATGILLVVAILGVGLLEPAAARHSRFERELAQRQDAVAALEAQKRALDARLAGHPDDSVRQEVAALEARIRDVDASLGTLSSNLVPPERMPAVVRELVTRSPGVSLAALETLPVDALGDAQEAHGATGTDDARRHGESGLFRHGIEVTVTGAYPALVAYCRRLEDMPLKTVWHRTRIDATHYPRVSMTLTLYTLSTERTWMTL
ncbi:MAG: hypothetical protein GC151_05770 [Betaproteobacteria bacterium]|nr:hypothetical protein [Betaproteobacteria bacterium]